MIGIVPLGVCLFVLAACSTGSVPKTTSSATPQSIMVKVAKQAQICWYKRKDKVFAPYRLASEVNSYSGKPRILIVPRNNPRGLPKLVAQAERGRSAPTFTRFGPLLGSAQGPRIARQLDAWAAGSTAC